MRLAAGAFAQSAATKEARQKSSAYQRDPCQRIRHRGKTSYCRSDVSRNTTRCRRAKIGAGCYCRGERPSQPPELVFRGSAAGLLGWQPPHLKTHKTCISKRRKYVHQKGAREWHNFIGWFPQLTQRDQNHSAYDATPVIGPKPCKHTTCP